MAIQTLPLRLSLEPTDLTEAARDAHRRALRICVAVEGAEHYFNAMRGTEVDREEVLEMLGMVAEEAEEIRGLLAGRYGGEVTHG